MEYAAKFEPAEEGGFIITFPDVPEALSQGNDEQDGREMARDALITIFEHYIRHALAIPAARRKGKKYHMMELPAMIAAKIELYNAFMASGTLKADLSRKLGIPQANVQRLFSFKNHTRLDQLEAAAEALGRHLVISIREAA